MDGLFDFLFTNPFLLLLIIGWLFTTFRGKPTDERQEQTKQTRPRQHQVGKASRSEQRGLPLGKFDVEKRPVVTASRSLEQSTVEESRLEQLEQLQDRLGAYNTQIQSLDSTFAKRQDISQQFVRKKAAESITPSRLSKRFNHKGLVDSIIMAEVLGKPRAKRLHHRDYM